MKTKILSSTLLIFVGIFSSLLMPQTLLAEESSCHDYPGHKEVLDQGNSVLNSIPTRSHRTRVFYEFGSSIRWSKRQRELRPVEEQLDFIRKEKPKLTRSNLKLLIRQLSDGYFYEQRFEDCRKFLEAVMDDLDPEEKEQAWEIIAKCRVLRSQNDYIGELMSYLNDPNKLSESRKQDFLDALALIQKIPKTTKDGSVVLRPNKDLCEGLIYAILNNNKEAIAAKDRVLNCFKLRAYLDNSRLDFGFDSEKLFSEPMFFDLPKETARSGKIFFYAPKYTEFDGALALCKKVGTVNDLQTLSKFWIDSLYDSEFDEDTQSTLIQNLPADYRSKLVSKCLLRCGPEFARIYDALKKRGWHEEAQVYLEQCVDKSLESSRFPGTYTITEYFLSRGDQNAALKIYDAALSGIAKLDAKGGSDIVLANERLSSLVEDLDKYKISSKNPIAIKTLTLYEKVKKDFDQFNCLELAEKLTRTGWRLVENGESKEATKLFDSALDIRRKNLKPNDRTLGLTYLDAGRAAAFCNDFLRADLYFQKAILIFSASPIRPDDDLITALESYGSLLNKNNRTVQAQKIYAQLKAIR